MKISVKTKLLCENAKGEQSTFFISGFADDLFCGYIINIDDVDYTIKDKFIIQCDN